MNLRSPLRVGLGLAQHLTGERSRVALAERLTYLDCPHAVFRRVLPTDQEPEVAHAAAANPVPPRARMDRVLTETGL